VNKYGKPLTSVGKGILLHILGKDTGQRERKGILRPASGGDTFQTVKIRLEIPWAQLEGWGENAQCLWVKQFLRWERNSVPKKGKTSEAAAAFAERQMK